MQRRSWLKLSVGAAAVLAVAGGAIALVEPGLTKDGALGSAAQRVFSAVSRAVLEGSLPQEATAQDKAITGLLSRVSDLTAMLPPHAQDELSQLLALLAISAGRWGLAGLSSDWSAASAAEVQAALQGMRTSSLALKRQAYAALHDITGAAYFSDPSTWVQLGYPGPSKI